MIIRWCMGVTLLTFMPSRVTKRAIKIRNESGRIAIKELVIGLRAERLVGDDQDRFPDDLQRGSDLVDMAMA